MINTFNKFELSVRKPKNIEHDFAMEKKARASFKAHDQQPNNGTQRYIYDEIQWAIYFAAVVVV